MSPAAEPLVLLVDDDAGLRLMLRTTLETAGFRVEEAGGCAAGLAAWERLRPELLLLDVLMPDGDGYGVCRSIRASDAGGNLPIVMVTGLDDSESINRAFESGATDFITKPIHWAMVGHRLRYILRASHALAELKHSEQRNRALMSAMPDLILRLDREARLLDHQLGPDTPWQAQLEHGSLAPLLPAAEQPALRAAIARALDQRQVECLEYAWQDGERQGFVEARFSALNGSEVLALLRDISERRSLERRLRLWATVFENSADAMIITDAERRMLSVNRACLTLSGYGEAELLGRLPRVFLDSQYSPGLPDEIAAVLADQGHWQGELWLQRKDGTAFPAWMTITEMHSEQGAVSNYILIFSDISDKKAAEARIDYLANRDAVTGLANRSLLNDRLGVALARNKRLRGRLAVLFIDLDRFKTINDSIGHAFGDKLLRIMAERIAACVRDEDTVSRLGGDEFAVLLPSIHGMSDVINLAERILARVGEACDIDSQLLRISASIGISLFPDDGDNADALMKNADAAMYLAKESGRNNYQFFTAELNTRALERLTLENRLRQALERGELELYYQPQLSAASGALTGVEALIRWRSPELGLVAPLRFIPLAEETGLILPIGELTIRQACRQIQAWMAQGLPAIPVAVNISAVQFQQKNFAKILRQLLLEAGIEGRWLELELTESMVMRDLDSVIASLHELKALGVNLAIDDFGTGYSSLNYLRHMPIDVLKIDQSFVRAMHSDPASLAIVEAIVALAKALGLECIAEGVETETELKLLQNLDCEMVQGYHYARPLPAAEFRDWYLARF